MHVYKSVKDKEGKFLSTAIGKKNIYPSPGDNIVFN